MLLRNVVIIQSGYLFRSQIQNEEAGAYRVIQMKDILDDGALDFNGAYKINLPSIQDDYLLRSGDVLFKCRGEDNKAILIVDPPEKTIVSSHFYILRVSSRQLLPEFLAWYLNQPSAQGYFLKTSVGTQIRMISKKSLGEMEVSLPRVERQRKIVNLFRLYCREDQLLTAIREKRRKLLNAIMLKYLSQA